MDYYYPFFFLKDKVFFLILFLLSLTPLKVGPKDPFTTLPLPFFLILLSSFSKLNVTYLKKRVQVLTLSLYTVP